MAASASHVPLSLLHSASAREFQNYRQRNLGNTTTEPLRPAGLQLRSRYSTSSRNRVESSAWGDGVGDSESDTVQNDAYMTELAFARKAWIKKNFWHKTTMFNIDSFFSVLSRDQ